MNSKSNIMKNFKTILFGLSLFFVGFQVDAQALTLNNMEDLGRQVQQNNNIINAEGKMVNTADMKGSPYWNDDFVSGKIIDKKNEKTLNVFLRYRIFDDIFEIKKTKTDSKILNMRRSNNFEVVLNNKKFVFLKNLPVKINGAYNGYSMVLAQPKEGEEGVTLYKRMSETYIPGQKAKSSYDREKKAELERKDYYFIKIGDMLYSIEPNKRKAADAFPSQTKRLENFIGNNNLKFNNGNQDRDLMRLVNYYNKLKNEKM